MPTDDPALDVLRRVFGYESFRGPQREVVDHVVEGGDALVLMPTGGGKSLCYQIPALVRDGVGVVVSPLIALMQDQVDALRALGVRAGFLNSTQAIDEQRMVERRRSWPANWTCSTWHRSGCGSESTLRLLDRRHGSRCSRSTKHTAWPSGVTTSGRTTSRCRPCTSAGRRCRGSR